MEYGINEQAQTFMEATYNSTLDRSDVFKSEVCECIGNELHKVAKQPMENAC